MNWLRTRLVADWRTLLGFASMRLHLLAVAIGALYAAMPVLDPSIAAALPAPHAAKAIAAYAAIGAIVRATKLKSGA
jgi:hypothetical protein